ncbi:MAG: hypothetical protein KF902_09090 [Phycisphaeraceae bacterium]|nr:hypothetical protein [Phycisphaeraceae bacterium]
MTSSGQTSHISVYDSIGESQASTLLRLGLLGPRRPIDDLADRLAEPGAAHWLDSVLEIGTTASIGKPRSILLMGETALADLVKVKDEGKRRYRMADTADGRLGGLAIYFVAIASGLVHHKQNICSRPPDVLHAALLDLAAAAAGHWSDMLTRAAATARTLAT